MPTSPTPTKRFVNWTGATWTPVSGTAYTLTGVTSIAVDAGGSMLRFSADADKYTTTAVNDFNEPTITVHTADLAWAMSLSVGMRGTFTVIHNDAKNGITPGGGAIQYTLNPAIVASCPVSGAHRQFGQATVAFAVESSDGQTNPLTRAAL
jgi:hypothetical protein